MKCPKNCDIRKNGYLETDPPSELLLETAIRRAPCLKEAVIRSLQEFPFLKGTIKPTKIVFIHILS